MPRLPIHIPIILLANHITSYLPKPLLGLSILGNKTGGFENKQRMVGKSVIIETRMRWLNVS